MGTSRTTAASYVRKGDPEPVRVHDFKIPELGKVAPYGVYDIAANHGWVSVGIDADTGAFAVESIRRWWWKLGQAAYPNAKCLTITADCGGSNGPQVKLWKRELQRFANEAGLKITVTHLPPGTSKWNKIEHRLFAFITMNWRGKPLVSHQVIVQLIGATTHRDRTEGLLRDRRQPLPERRQGDRPRDAGDQHHTSTNSTASGTTPSRLTNNRLEVVISRQTLSARRYLWTDARREHSWMRQYDSHPYCGWTGEGRGRCRTGGSLLDLSATTPRTPWSPRHCSPPFTRPSIRNVPRASVPWVGCRRLSWPGLTWLDPAIGPPSPELVNAIVTSPALQALYTADHHAMTAGAGTVRADGLCGTAGRLVIARPTRKCGSPLVLTARMNVSTTETRDVGETPPVPHTT